MGKLSLRKVKWPGCQEPVLHVRTNDMLSLRVLEVCVCVYVCGRKRERTHTHTHTQPAVPSPSRGCDRDWNRRAMSMQRKRITHTSPGKGHPGECERGTIGWQVFVEGRQLC